MAQLVFESKRIFSTVHPGKIYKLPGELLPGNKSGSNSDVIEDCFDPNLQPNVQLPQSTQSLTFRGIFSGV
jgi:hypothetical protein